MVIHCLYLGHHFFFFKNKLYNLTLLQGIKENIEIRDKENISVVVGVVSIRFSYRISIVDILLWFLKLYHYFETIKVDYEEKRLIIPNRIRGHSKSEL